MQRIRCAVNVQHNCIGSKCKPEQSQIIRQEREDTGQRSDIIAHEGSDMLLNMCQMHSAKFVQRLALPPPLLNRDLIIQRACALEWQKFQPNNAGVEPHLPVTPQSHMDLPPSRGTQSSIGITRSAGASDLARHIFHHNVSTSK